MASEAQIRRYLAGAANQFGVDPGLLTEIARLESGFRPGAVNDWDSNAQAGIPSHGLMQFIQPTFESFWREAQQSNPQQFRGGGSWQSWQDQARLAAWAIANGKGSHWATYDRAKAGAGNVRIPEGASMEAGAPAGVQPTVTPTREFGAWKKLLGEDSFVGKMYDKKYNRDLAATQQPMSTSTASSAPAGGGGGSGSDHGPFRFLPRKPGEPGWKYLQRLGSTGGLRNDPGNGQTTGGNHAAGSPHYDGRAIDYGDALNGQPLLDQWAKFLNANYDEIGLERVIWQAPGHYNHVDAATRRSLTGKQSSLGPGFMGGIR